MPDTNVKAERSVIITLSPVQAQHLIQVLQQRADTLQSRADIAAQPGEKGRLLSALDQTMAVHQITVRAYNDWIGEESNGPTT